MIKNLIKEKNNRIIVALIFIYIISLLSLPNLLFHNESIYVYKWYFTLLGIGILYLPLTIKTFNPFKDKGYIFAKTIGITLSSIVFFWFSNLRITTFTSTNVLFVTLVTSLFFIPKFKNEIKQIDKNIIKKILLEELIFFIILILLLYIKGFNPFANTTEKYMDFGFMSSMMKTDYFPVQDFWFSGTNLNYYYFGQYISTFITKLSFVPVEYGYNLMLMSICALATIQVYSIVKTLLLNKLDSKNKNNFSTIGAIISSIAVCYMGNFHYVIYRIIKHTYAKLTNATSIEPYWFPTSTRYIGYNPDLPDKTIHEFPSYSFILGDLHAHVINIIFVLTIIAIIVSFALDMEKKKGDILISFKKQNIKQNLKEYLLKPLSIFTIFVGILIGLFMGTNYWDYPIYLVVVSLTFLFVNYRIYGFHKETTIYSIIQIIYTFLIAKLTILPFVLNFDKIASQVCLAKNHTLIHQFLVLWAFPIICVTIGIIYIIKDFIKDNLNSIKELKFFQKISTIIQKANISDLMIMLFSCCAIGLIIAPEIIYMKDIYGEVYARANTMFKLTYQAFIMFGIATGYFITTLITHKRTTIKTIFASLFFITTLLCTGYFINGCNSWFGNIFDNSKYISLNALTFIDRNPIFKDDKFIIDYINKNVDKDAVILESCNASYTDNGRISISTGNPTVLGWYTHEWLWKNNEVLVQDRYNDIFTIYTTNNKDYTQSILNKYDVDYIYIGELEYRTYNDEGYPIQINTLLSLGKVVASSNINNTDRPTYLIRIYK